MRKHNNTSERSVNKNNQSDKEAKNYTCGGEGSKMSLSPEGHDPREINREVVFEFDNCTVYYVEQDCRNCPDGGWSFPEVVGERTLSVAEFGEITYGVYESLYDNPRPISFATLQKLVARDDPWKINALAGYLDDAVRLGHKDNANNRDKKEKEVVWKIIFPDKIEVDDETGNLCCN